LRFSRKDVEARETHSAKDVQTNTPAKIQTAPKAGLVSGAAGRKPKSSLKTKA
jgi:hypothetical protein